MQNRASPDDSLDCLSTDFLEQLYSQFRLDPAEVPEQWRSFFSAMEQNGSPPPRRLPAPLPAPVGTAPVHRTGDIVRFDSDHGYVFLGRRDHMVKVRGYRIELEDVEAAVLKSEAVHEAACVVTGTGDDEIRLEAYVVPVDGAASSPAELRRHCLAVLPRYMVPADFHLVDALPRTSTGKTDRRALTTAADAGKGVSCTPAS